MSEWGYRVTGDPVVMTLPAFHFSYSSPPLSAKRKAVCTYIEFLLFLELDFLQAQLSSCHSHSTLSGTDVNCLGTRASFPCRSPDRPLVADLESIRKSAPGLTCIISPLDRISFLQIATKMSGGDFWNLPVTGDLEILTVNNRLGGEKHKPLMSGFLKG